ncbi:hypothetical protein [Roseivirga pacifica]|uniref:hypothetical protein n=1 Tax=Roseivirga pacifica TaxID=1267423 RepID=UPI002095B04A|nr:hypothetical protein [Roseivirga pacifica]MCO6359893.1 hypothetical protein [Roseivirga pacifica]MCO6367263.1 hypothetical protein [Roseivirga pacifica]MCO6370205.1 hypothetical protein [Roseivirga pacifica]MCO6374920.1 hypothetical protein [Roseivirga pacifica]MCO6380178.1 hypothetical protein [Roseivirga pacifica]
MQKPLSEDKEKLISKINQLNDQKVIDDLMRLLAVDFDDTIYLTNDLQKSAVSEAREELKAGQGISDSDAKQEIEDILEY